MRPIWIHVFTKSGRKYSAVEESNLSAEKAAEAIEADMSGSGGLKHLRVGRHIVMGSEIEAITFETGS